MFRVRALFRRIFHVLLNQLGIRRLREHSFFGALLPKQAVIADFGAHRGEFLSALKSEFSISRALLIEANPELAAYLKETFGNETDVLHAALIGRNNKEPVVFTLSTNPESSSIFRESAAACGIADQVDVPAIDLSHVIAELDGRVDLVKVDIEGAEVGILQTASASDLASCSQLTVEFHTKCPPITRRDVDRVCQRMRCEGYGIVNANWPYLDDVLFVNLRRIDDEKRLGFRCRMALANMLFGLRGAFFGTLRLLNGNHS